MNAPNDRAAWMQGGDTQCACAPVNTSRTYRLVLLGAPGVGKGTQAEKLAQELGACQLSTGDVFRHAKAGTDGALSPAMKEALVYMRKGELVPDATVMTMIRERSECLRCRGGFLLDGFPRTVPQAMALDEILRELRAPLDAVICYALPIDTIVARLSGRRTCAACKAVYHVAARPPARSGLCDACGGRLIQRDDDRPEAVRVRMDAYAVSTTPLIDFYRDRQLLIEISADGDPDAIYRSTRGALTAHAEAQRSEGRLATGRQARG